ncbi:hypothetical protein [Rhizobium cremeum]|uniref:hypothetical protein n=1 Tax=Rhizobium cremeum TaxID=2813827 RepID=UPI0039DFBAC9
MTNDPDHFFEQQDMAVQMLIVENKGDELTDILVEALRDALSLLQEEREATVH